MTRTVALGKPSDEMKRVYDTVFRAQAMCVEALAAGKNCYEIDRLARDYIDAQGYAGRFGHGLGHAVGIDIHEEPRLSPKCREDIIIKTIVTISTAMEWKAPMEAVLVENPPVALTLNAWQTASNTDIPQSR